MLLGDFLLQQHEQYWRHWPRSNSNIYMLLKQDNTRIHTHNLSLLSLDCVGPRNWCCSTSRPASLYHHKPFCAATPSPREGPSLSITHSHPRQHDQALPESQSERLLSSVSLSISQQGLRHSRTPSETQKRGRLSENIQKAAGRDAVSVQ